MKKIISVLAMALLVIGAAQAQNQVRKMVVRTTYGNVVKYDTKYVEDVTFEIIDLPNVPTTVEEAETMLVGFWKWDLSHDNIIWEVFPDIDAFYIIITMDLKFYIAAKVADSATDEYAEYAGKYIAMSSGNVIVNSENPTTGELEYPGSSSDYFNNLEQNSFVLNSDDLQASASCHRVEPFEYILMENDLMKK